MIDPTLQASGSLQCLLKIDWDSGFRTTFGTVSPGPDKDPGPPWSQGKQYLATGPNTVVLPFGVGPGSGSVAFPVSVPDMSNATVAPGKSYALTVNVSPWGNNWIQLYFVLTGTAAGTTVLPGFGLWSLNTNPNAWTYLTPTQFTGEWEIELFSPTSALPVWLSIQYAPPRSYGSPNLISRLSFICSGGGSGLGAQDQPSPPPAGDIQYLNRSSAPAVTRARSGEVLAGSDVAPAASDVGRK